MQAANETDESDAIGSGDWLELVRDSGFDDISLWDVVVEGNESDWLLFLHALDRAAEEQADLVTSIAVTRDRDPVDGIPARPCGSACATG